GTEGRQDSLPMKRLVPNLRLVKPLSKYRNERARIFGRERVADQHTQTSNNTREINLPFTPICAEWVEIYHNDMRLLGGYELKGRRIIFDEPMDGQFFVVCDRELPDESQEWLEIDFERLLYSDDYEQTSYGTDRREGPRIATVANPIIITQPSIGFCRLSQNRDKILYCPKAGLYGRDSITYALRTDLGQLSEYRCIDIKVRNPNHVPELRVRFVTLDDKASALIDGVLHEVVSENPDAFATFDPIYTGSTVELQNVASIGLNSDVYLVLQGKDEEGAWYNIDEFYDLDEVEFNVDTTDGVTMADVELAEPITGYVGDLMLFTIPRDNESSVNIEIVCRGMSLFSLSLVARSYGIPEGDGYTVEYLVEPVPEVEHVTAAHVPDLNISGFSFTPEAVNYDVEVSNSGVGYSHSTITTNSSMRVTSDYHAPYANETFGQDVDSSTRLHVFCNTSRIHEENTLEVVAEPNVPYFESMVLWESADAFSGMWAVPAKTEQLNANVSLKTIIYEV